MALFLESNLSSSNDQYASFEEALIAGITLSEESAELSEAIYQADFIIHQKLQTLDEAAGQRLQEGFVYNVWAKVKVYAAKAWAWVKGMCSKIKAKAIETYNRIKERVAGGNVQSISFAKKELKKWDAKIAFADKIAALVSKLPKAKTKDALASIGKSGADAKTAFDSAMEAANKTEGSVTVSMTYFDKITKQVGGAAEVVIKAADEALKSLDEIEAKAKAMQDKATAAGATPDTSINEVIEAARNAANNAKSLTSQLARTAA